MLKGRDIIIFGDDWGRHPSTIQHVARILAKSNRILWVSSLGLRKPHLKVYDVKRIIEKVKKMLVRPMKQASQIPVIEIHPFIFPFYDVGVMRIINVFLLRIQIQRMMKKLNFSDVILLISTPVVADLVGKFGEVSSYYLCFDDYSRFNDVYRSIPSMERAVLNQVNGCFSISDVLIQRRSCKSGENHYLPQGVDDEHFNSIAREIPEQIKNIKKPIIGFFGLISNWVDVDLVRECAKTYPSISFVLIGKSSIDLSTYLDVHNMFFLGELAYEQLPAYAQMFDVGIVPFVVNELTKAANPIKILEYLSLGLPVVSTDLPEANKFSDHIYIAKNRQEFIAHIKLALESDNPEKKIERQLKARQYSWSAVCETLSQHIQSIENELRVRIK